MSHMTRAYGHEFLVAWEIGGFGSGGHSYGQNDTSPKCLVAMLNHKKLPRPLWDPLGVGQTNVDHHAEGMDHKKDLTVRFWNGTGTVEPNHRKSNSLWTVGTVNRWNRVQNRTGGTGTVLPSPNKRIGKVVIAVWVQWKKQIWVSS